MTRKIVAGLLFVVIIMGFGGNAFAAENITLMPKDSFKSATTSGLTITPPEYSQFARYDTARAEYVTEQMPVGKPHVVTGLTGNSTIFTLEKSKVMATSSKITKNDSVTVNKLFNPNYSLLNQLGRVSGFEVFDIEGDLTGLTTSSFEITDYFGYLPRVYEVNPANHTVTVSFNKMLFSQLFGYDEKMFSLKLKSTVDRTLTVIGMTSKVTLSSTDTKILKITHKWGHQWFDKRVLDSVAPDFKGIIIASPKENEEDNFFKCSYTLCPYKAPVSALEEKFLEVKVTMDYDGNFGYGVFEEVDGGWKLDYTTGPDDLPNGKKRIGAYFKWDSTIEGKVAPSLVTEAKMTLDTVQTKTKDLAPEGRFYSPNDNTKEKFLGFGYFSTHPDAPIEVVNLEANPTKKKDGIGGTVEMTRGELIIAAITNTIGNGNNALIYGPTYRHTVLSGFLGKGWSSRLDASLEILSNGLTEEENQLIRRMAIYRDGMANDELFIETALNSKVFEGISSDKVIDLTMNPQVIYDFATCALTTFQVKYNSTPLVNSYYLTGEKTSNVETVITWEGDGVRPLTMTMKEAGSDMPYSFQFSYTDTTEDGKTPIRVYQKKGESTLGTWVDFIIEGGVLSEIRYCYPRTGDTAIYPTVKLYYDSSNLLQYGYSALFRSQANNCELYDLKKRFSVGYQTRPDLNCIVVSNEATYVRKEISPGVFDDVAEASYTFEYDWSDPKNKISKAILSGTTNKYTFGYIDGEVIVSRTGTDNSTLAESTETHNYAGEVSAVTNAAGDGQSISYSAATEHFGQVESTSMMDRNGNTAYPTNFSYVDGEIPNGMTKGNSYKKTDTSASGTITTYFYDFEEATQGDLNGDGITNQSYGNVVKMERGTGTPLASTTLTRYYADGQVKETIDAEGMITRNVYYLSGEQGYPNLKQTIVDADRLNLTTEYTYDDWGRVLTTKDPKGNITTNEYNGQGQLVRTIGPAPFNYQTLYTYLPDGQQDEIWVENKDGNLDPTQPWLKTRYVYDLSGRIKWTEREKTPGVWIPSSGETTYLADGRVDVTRDIFGVQTKYEYDTMNRNHKTTHAFGTTIATSTETLYDEFGRSNQTVDGRGNIPTTTMFDDFGRAFQTVDAFGVVSETVYDTFGRAWKNQTWNAGHTIMLAETVNDYDALDRVWQTQALWKEAPGGPAYIITSKQEFDRNGRVIHSWDANNNLTTTIYDTAGRVDRTINALGQPTIYTYDANGNTIKVTDALGHFTTSEYDNLNRKIADVDANTNRTEYYYDSRGNQVETKDARGNSTKYTFDALGRKVLYEDAEGNHTTYIYDDAGRLITETNARGAFVTYAYDELGRQSTVVDTYGKTTVYSYDLNGNQISVTDKRGYPTAFEYDILNRQTKMTNALGKFTLTEYDAQGRQWKFTNLRGKETQYVYDSLSRTTAIIDAMSNQTSFIYDNNGNKLVEKNEALNLTTAYQYDALNRVWKTIDAKGGETITTYNEVGNTWKVKDALNNETVNEYFENNRLKNVINAKGEMEQYTYDGNGNRLTLTNARTKTTTFGYDRNNRLTTITDALNGISRKTYDQVGNLFTATDAENHTTTFTYDLLNRELTKTDAINAVVTKTYDENGNLATIKDNNNNITTYTYDALNRQSETLFADGTRIIRTFDDNGNVLTTTDQNGTVVTNTIDNLDRVTQRDIVPGVGVVGTTQQTFGYDAAGRLTNATDNNYPTDGTTMSAVAITYDELSRVTGETQTIGGLSHAVTSQFNLMNRTNLNYPGGKNLTFQHDQLNRITNINQTQTIANYQYTATGRVSQKTLTNNTVMNVTHDDLDRELTRNHTSFGTIIVNFEHTFDKVGNKRYERRAWTGRDKGDFYSYDAIYRLTNVMYGVPGTELEAFKNSGTIPTTNERSTGFTMDGVGNRTNVFDTQYGTTSYVTNNMNEYTNVNGTAKTNDEAGNLTDDGTKTFKWDFANRLREVYNKSDNSLIVKYLYDARGRRVARISGTGGGGGALMTATGFAKTNDAKNPQARAARINALQSKIRGLENALAQHLKNKPATNNTATPAPIPTAKGKSKLTAFVESQQAGASNNALNNLTQELGQTYELLGEELNLTGNCYWFYDGDEIVEQRDDTDTLMSSWVNGIQIDERIEIELSGIKYYYHLNTLGTVYALTDGTGVVVERYEYDSYGKATIYDPTLTIQRTYSIAGNFSMFTGRQLDYETGLYYYRARMYDPETGRFLSHDPMGYIDGMGLYEYVKGSPIENRDPLGKWTIKRNSNLPRAVATADKDAEPYKDLANIMLLEPDEVYLWLRPFVPNEIVLKGDEFYVPNKFIVITGLGTFADDISPTIHAMEEYYVPRIIREKCLKFGIQMIEIQASEVYSVGQALRDMDLYGLLYSGHGNDSIGGSLIPLLDEANSVRPARYTKYRIPLLMLFACNSASYIAGSRNYSWQSNVSTNGGKFVGALKSYSRLTIRNEGYPFITYLGKENEIPTGLTPPDERQIDENRDRQEENYYYEKWYKRHIEIYKQRFGIVEPDPTPTNNTTSQPHATNTSPSPSYGGHVPKVVPPTNINPSMPSSFPNHFAQ